MIVYVYLKIEYYIININMDFSKLLDRSILSQITLNDLKLNRSKYYMIKNNRKLYNFINIRYDVSRLCGLKNIVYIYNQKYPPIDVLFHIMNIVKIKLSGYPEAYKINSIKSKNNRYYIDKLNIIKYVNIVNKIIGKFNMMCITNMIPICGIKFKLSKPSAFI